jgi:hypothetical protein
MNLAQDIFLPSLVIRHCLKGVNRFEASVGCCDGKYCVLNSKFYVPNIENRLE